MTATVAPWDIERPTPQPSTAVASGQAAPAPQFTDAGPRALMAAAQANEAIAGEADRYAEHIDTLQAQDALNKVRAAKEDLTYGDAGFMKIKGGDVLKPTADGSPLLDSYTGRLGAASDALAANLSPRAKMLYNERFAGERTAFKSDIAKHSIQQTELFNDQVYKDGSTQDVTEAARYADDPAKLSAIADRAADRTAKYRATKGFDPVEGATAARSTILATAIQTKLDQGNSAGAIADFDRFKDRLDGHDLATLQPRIRDKGRQLDAEDWASKALPVPGGSDNNIGNIAYTNIAYPGKGGRAGNFETFTSPEHGVAAAYNTILAKARQNGGSITFADLIGGNVDKGGKVSGWAATPRTEAEKADPMLRGNNAAAYATRLAKSVGLNPGDQVPIGDDAQMEKILREQNVIEKGKPTVSDEMYGRGIKLAKGDASIAPTGGDDPLHAYKLRGLGLMQQTEADNTLDPDVKARRLQVLRERIGTTEAIYTAERSQAVNDRNTAATVAMSNPGLYVPGTFGKIADRQRAAGDFAEAERSDYLQAHESELLNFAKLPPGEVKNALAHTMGGVGGRIATAMIANDHLQFTQMRKEAHDADVAFTKGVSDGLPVGSVIDNARQAHALYSATGDTANAKRIETQINSLLGGENVAKLPPGQAAATLRDLRERGASNGLNQQEAMLFDAAKKAVAKQEQNWKEDPLATFAALRPDMMPPNGLPPVDLAMPPQQLALALKSRADLANRTAHYIDPNTSAPNVSALTASEVSTMSKTLQGGTVPARQMSLANLGQALPPEQMKLVARQLAGNDQMGAVWATALSFYQRNQPGDRQIADSLIAGGNQWLEGGPEGKERIKLDAANWLPQIDETLGHARSNMDGRDKAIQNSAIGARYVALMGSQDPTKLNNDVLQKAIKDIVGEKTTINGGDILLPSGVADYQWRDGLEGLKDGDLPTFASLAGKPITAQMIKSNATFESVGDGLYHVWLPDPKRDTTVKLATTDGKPYVLDIRPLVARTGSGPNAIYSRFGVQPTGEQMAPR